MRVVSWNVNGIRACVRRGFVDFVDRSGADIVGVQEARARSCAVFPSPRSGIASPRTPRAYLRLPESTHQSNRPDGSTALSSSPCLAAPAGRSVDRAGVIVAQAYRNTRPVDMMDTVLRAVPTSPQAAEHRHGDQGPRDQAA